MDTKDSVVVEVEVREPGSSNVAKRLRAAGKLPAVLYGGGRDSRPITVDPRQLVTILKSEHGQNTLLSLKVGDGREQAALVHDYDVHPITQRLLHADFKRIALDVEVEVNVPVELIGEPAGVKLDKGILDQVIREVQVRCLPTAIPDNLSVDVSELVIGDAVHVSDLVIPEGVELLADLEQTIATVAPPAVAEVEVEEEEEGLIIEADEPEVIGKGGAAEDEAEDEGREE